jgi:hypothetical protein
MQPKRYPKQRLSLLLLIGVLCLPMQSCFTLTLWGGEEVRETDAQGNDDWVWSFEDADIGWDDVWIRVLLTPVAAGLDCLTFPVQVWLSDDE